MAQKADKPLVAIPPRGNKGAASAVAQVQPAKAPKSINKTVRRGVGIKESTFAEIEKIARDEGLNVNAVMRFGLEYFIEHYQDGEAKSALKKRTVTHKTISR